METFKFVCEIIQTSGYLKDQMKLSPRVCHMWCIEQTLLTVVEMNSNWLRFSLETCFDPTCECIHWTNTATNVNFEKLTVYRMNESQIIKKLVKVIHSLTHISKLLRSIQLTSIKRESSLLTSILPRQTFENRRKLIYDELVTCIDLLNSVIPNVLTSISFHI
jgi:hypothetical protein